MATTSATTTVKTSAGPWARKNVDSATASETVPPATGRPGDRDDRRELHGGLLSRLQPVGTGDQLVAKGGAEEHHVVGHHTEQQGDHDWFELARTSHVEHRGDQSRQSQGEHVSDPDRHQGDDRGDDRTEVQPDDQDDCADRRQLEERRGVADDPALLGPCRNRPGHADYLVPVGEETLGVPPGGSGLARERLIRGDGRALLRGLLTFARGNRVQRRSCAAYARGS